MKPKISKGLRICVFIVLIVVLILGLSYGYMSFSSSQEEANLLKSACFDVTYQEDVEGVNMKYYIPISDEDAMKQDAYTITLTNNCQEPLTYDVYLNIMSESSTPDSIIRMNYNDEIANLTDFNQTTAQVSGAKRAYKISTAFIAPAQTTTLSFRTWMSSEVTTEGQNSQFVNKISINTNAIEENLLANKIFTSNTLVTATPDFSKGEPPSSTSVTNTGSGLYMAQDDDGNSYYFRGAISNNYVSFAGYTWRIVRINGDGTVRLILNGDTGELVSFNNNVINHKNIAYTYDNTSACTINSPCISTYHSTTKIFTNNKNVTNSTIKEYLENTWYQEIANYDKYIAQGTFCNDTSITNSSGTTNYYGAYQRVYVDNEPTLKCPATDQTYGGYYKSKIGLLSVDELVMGGYSIEGNTNNNFLYSSDGSFWNMSPGFSESSTVYSGGVFNGNTNGNVDSFNVLNGLSGSYLFTSDKLGVRPVINLRSDVAIASGDGTESNPYVVET